MQDDPRYDDVVAEVVADLVGRAEAARAAGVPEVWIDPGIGFGKTFDAQPRAARPPRRASSPPGFPVLVGTSRKGFLGRAARSRPTAPPAPAPVDDRLEGSLATATWAMACGAAMVRVHDVRATAHAALVIGGQITKDAA